MTTGEPSPYDRSQDRQPPGRDGASSTAPRRSGVRRFLPLVAAAWAVLEIWLLIWLAGHVGALGVFAVLLAGFVLGAVIIKRAGRKAWRNLAESLQPGATSEQTDAALKSGDAKRGSGGNALAMLGGLLLMLPGLASDVIGLLCVFPPTAMLLRKAARRTIASSSLGDAVQQARAAQEQVRIHRPDGKVVPGEVIQDGDGQVIRDTDRRDEGPSDRRPGSPEA